MLQEEVGNGPDVLRWRLSWSSKPILGLMVEAWLCPMMKVVFSRAEETSSQPQVWSVAEVSSIGFAFDWLIHLSFRLVSLQGLIHVSGSYKESLLHSRVRKKKKQSLPKQKLAQNVPLMFCWWRQCFAQLVPQSLTKLSGNLSTSIYLALCSVCCAVPGLSPGLKI